MNLRRTGLAALWLALAACPWTARAHGAGQRPIGLPHEFFTAQLATALDADSQADWIRAYPCVGPDGGGYFCVRVVVSQTHSTQTIILKTNAKGVRVTSHDVDGDHLQDVLVMSADDGRPLGVWINNGRGGFSESDTTLYPASDWHEDPLLCPTPPPEYPSLAFVNGDQDSCLAPFAPNAERPAAARRFSNVEVASPCSARFGDHLGRAPPLR